MPFHYAMYLRSELLFSWKKVKI